MTRDKDFKRIVRQRMAKTGESFVTARTAILTKGEGLAMKEDETLRVRTIHETSGRWAARSDLYPRLVGYGTSEEESKERLSELIMQHESAWQNHVDDECVRYIELQDD